MMTESVLILRASRGDDAAVRALHARYRNYIGMIVGQSYGFQTSRGLVDRIGLEAVYRAAIESMRRRQYPFPPILKMQTRVVMRAVMVGEVGHVGHAGLYRLCPAVTRARGEWTGEGDPPDSWIADRIGRTPETVSDYRRFESERNSLGITVDPIDPAPPMGARAIDRIDLDRALATLSERLRGVMLARSQGWTYPEIADAIGVSPSRAAQLVQDARRRMRAALGEGWEAWA